MTKQQSKVYIIHENEAWVDPLFRSLDALNVPYSDWFINNGKLNLNDVPPEGVFYNRMSASAHTREHRFALELSESILAWLDFHDRKVINNRNALSLETRKSEQQLRLNKFGIATPKTIVANNTLDLLSAAEELHLEPFIVKPNRGGKGLGVRLYRSIDELKSDIKSGETPQSLDGILLVQEYIKPKDDRITRLEFIGGKFYYAVSIDSSGGFELCPADACNVGDVFCPASPSGEKFHIIENYNDHNLHRYQEFLEDSGIEIGAIELVTDATGLPVAYDVNTNTNYNSRAEELAIGAYNGMFHIAEYLKAELFKAMN